MLVVLSDLHFQDTRTSGAEWGSAAEANVQPVAFDSFWRHLAVLAERARVEDAPTIVLGGDVLELLCSERWLEAGTRPYNFAGPPSPEALATASAIGHAILDENQASIRALAGAREARFVYLYGNHDRLLRTDEMAPVRARLADLLGGCTFADQHRDERHGVLALHGHELDWTNGEHQHTRLFEGVPSSSDASRRLLAPLGDWIALDLNTRLPHLARELLGADPHEERWPRMGERVRRDLYRRLLDLGDLRPSTEVLRWLVRHPSDGAPPGGHDGAQAPLPSETVDAIAAFLGDLMNELVARAMPRIEPWLDAHGRPLFDRLALGAVALLGSTSYTAASLPSLMERISSYLAEQDKPWLHAERIDAWREGEGRLRYLVCGHTHDARVLPLRQGRARPLSTGGRHGEQNDTHWYVNTGTWRKTVLRSPISDEEEVHGAVKQVAFAVFHDEAETFASSGRRGTSFDLWQAATERF